MIDDYQHFPCASEEYTQNNLDYLILNMIHLAIQIHPFMWGQIF